MDGVYVITEITPSVKLRIFSLREVLVVVLKVLVKRWFVMTEHTLVFYIVESFVYNSTV